jgi:type III restriction enzyme
MKQVVIENPILNSPYTEPTHHFQFCEQGITNTVVNARRVSSYFVPIARPRKKGKGDQLTFETEWTQDRIEENEFINRIRVSVGTWRSMGRPGVTSTTRRLLEYWCAPNREKRLFFCQIEAMETAIYLTEVAKKKGEAWLENDLHKAKEDSNPGILRIAFKMATGSGKTVVMAMLITWHVLNKLASPQDNRFSDAFLIVTPGITIRDRLRVLLPNDPQNYYRQWDIVPVYQQEELGKAKIVITNFHAFKLRERSDAARLTKAILSPGISDPFAETPQQMVRRVCRELGSKRNIVIINDEAHHCYRKKEDGGDVKLSGDERKEAERHEARARVWISGLHAIQQKLGVKVVYDLSATPFFLRASGYVEGTMFPWVVSDFSLIDAIESGIVKIPRVPVSDDQMLGEQPTYRNLWLRIRDDLPKKGRKTEEVAGEPMLPKELQGALHSLYGNYEKYYRRWQDNNNEASAKGQTPPVFIVVCNNTNVSKMVYDYISGWEKELPDNATVVVPGHLPIFNNEENGQWRPQISTILIDSEQLESGEAMSPDFKKLVAPQIEEFKAEYRQRFPGRDVENIGDEDLLREVMNTVGKPGKLGEHVKCVVSVSMLTEGWDVNTVTHVLGVRAFSTQLLCEQVIGRALRRVSYVTDEQDRLSPEYAEVYGVPFSFLPCSGSAKNPKPGLIPTRVRALAERIASEIAFPRLIGYRYVMPHQRLTASFGAAAKMVLSTVDIPTKTENAPIVGELSIHTLDDLKNKRLQEVAFLLAKLTLEKYFRSDGLPQPNDLQHLQQHKWDNEVQAWLFPQLLAITKAWLAECVVYQDNAFPQMLLLLELAYNASDRIYQAIVQSCAGDKTLMPILRPFDTLGSTRHVDFDTTRPVFATHAQKCHVNYVVADTESWEQKMAQALEDMPEVVSYVKNQSLGFAIPYTWEGEEHNYLPDFIVYIEDNHDDLLRLIVEVTGARKKDKEVKVATAQNLWLPAVNHHGAFGRWDFLEITDPWNAQNAIREFIGKEKT